MESLKIAIVGSGAVGCHYGGLLHRAGHEVHFLLRGDLDAVRAKGIHLRGPEGDVHLYPVRAAGNPNEIGPCDLVIISLKATSNADLPKLVPPLLRENTRLLTLQNGLGNEEFLAGHFGEDRVMGGICFVTLNRVEPGVVRNFNPGYIKVGEPFGNPGDRAEETAALFTDAGVRCRVASSLMEARWRKLCWNIPFNGLAIAGGGIDTAAILADDGLSGLARELMEETRAVAASLGHAIEDEFLDKQISQTLPMGPYKPSSLIDYLEGREIEIEAIWGEAWRTARRQEVETPRLGMLYRLIQSLARSRG